MCGIAGYVDLAFRHPSRRILQTMAYTLRRRGPDAHGVLIDGPCGLAHTRLSIIDLEGSHQPMQVTDTPISLVYNGELYNYRELRQYLQSMGTRFKSLGDTEVLLRCLDRDWTHALPKLDGMFGFAAWHRRSERLLLARDPIGVKPLFYGLPAPGVIVFGSEIKALLVHPAFDRQLDLDSLRQVLRFGAVYGDRSLYRGIRQLEPGHLLEFDASGIRIRRYFDPNEEVSRELESMRRLTDQQIIRKGEQLFETAVHKRLVADVPVGAFLSGGVDSSLIVATIRRCREPEEQLCTFSVGFHGDHHSELPFARKVAEANATDHVEVSVTESDYMSIFSEMTACRDAPISEPQDLAVARMSEIARQKVKVVLSGEGADEVFGGYPKYRFANVPRLLHGALRALGPEQAARLAGLLRLDARRTLVAARAISCNEAIDRFVQWFARLDRERWFSLLPGLEWSDHQWADTRREQLNALVHAAAPTALGKAQTIDCLTWLPGNLLERGDRMTMSAGLEMRVPFLDKGIVPYGLALKDRLKVRGRSSKRIVRQWADRRLPQSIVRRAKCGFHIPLADWLRGRMRSMLFSYLTADCGLCGTYGNRRNISRVLEAHVSGKIDAGLELWALFATEVWYQDVFLSSKTRQRAGDLRAVVA